MSATIRVLLGILLAVFVAFGQKKPDTRPIDPNETVEACFEADGWSSKGRLEQARLIKLLEPLAPLTDKEEKKWVSQCLKLAAKGTKLEKKSGQHFLWDKPKDHGLYIVGGESKNPKGLIICMHGGGAGAGDAWSSHGEYNGATSKLDWLAIYPEVLEKTEHGWTDSGTEEFVMELVEAALRTWKIDRDRVYFSGHSMGGYGTWTLGAHHADRVAALAPSAGAPTPITGPSGGVEDVEAGVIPCLRNVPIVIYQSDDDPNVPPAANRAAAKKLDEAAQRWGGFPHEYWEVPGRQHQEAPGGMEALLAKIKDRARNPRPTKIVWQPALTWKHQFYWLWWDEPAKGSIVVAEVDRAKNEVRVTSSVEARGLEVLLDDKLVDLTKEVVVMLGDKEVFRGKPERKLSTIVKTSLHGDPELVFACSVKVVP